MEVASSGVGATRSHWWWRPGWGPGTRYVTFHLTFEAAAGLRAEAERLGGALTAVSEVGPVPPRWLHLTMTGVGHTTDLDPEALTDLAGEALDLAGSVPAQPLHLQQLLLTTENVAYQVRPDPWLHELKALQEQVVRSRFAVVNTQPGGFRPHISLAYFRGPVDRDALAGGLRAAGPVELDVAEVDLSLIELGRDDEQYTWRTLDQRRLSLAGRAGP